MATHREPSRGRTPSLSRYGYVRPFPPDRHDLSQPEERRNAPVRRGDPVTGSRGAATTTPVWVRPGPPSPPTYDESQREAHRQRLFDDRGRSAGRSVVLPSRARSPSPDTSTIPFPTGYTMSGGGGDRPPPAHRRQGPVIRPDAGRSFERGDVRRTASSFSGLGDVGNSRSGRPSGVYMDDYGSDRGYYPGSRVPVDVAGPNDESGRVPSTAGSAQLRVMTGDSVLASNPRLARRVAEELGRASGPSSAGFSRREDPIRQPSSNRPPAPQQPRRTPSTHHHTPGIARPPPQPSAGISTPRTRRVHWPPPSEAPSDSLSNPSVTNVVTPPVTPAPRCTSQPRARRSSGVADRQQSSRSAAPRDASMPRPRRVSFDSGPHDAQRRAQAAEAESREQERQERERAALNEQTRWRGEMNRPRRSSFWSTGASSWSIGGGGRVS